MQKGVISEDYTGEALTHVLYAWTFFQYYNYGIFLLEIIVMLVVYSMCKPPVAPACCHDY